MTYHYPYDDHGTDEAKARLDQAGGWLILCDASPSYSDAEGAWVTPQPSIVVTDAVDDAMVYVSTEACLDALETRADGALAAAHADVEEAHRWACAQLGIEHGLA